MPPPTGRSAALEQQDISVYCAGYVDTAVLALAMEGLILRLLTLMAMFVCPRGVTLEPLVVAAAGAGSRCRSWLRSKARRKASAPGKAGASAVAPSSVQV